MRRRSRTLLRQATAIHGCLPAEVKPISPKLPTDNWHACERLQHRLTVAQERDWQHAAQQLRRDLRLALRILQEQLGNSEARLLTSTPNYLATVQEIYCDLVMLEQEFPVVVFDHKAKMIAVTSDPIELEDVYLGAFKIELNLASLAGGPPYSFRIIALDPNPAASSDDTIHPHVEGNTLCEGDAKQPIRHALRDGRLLDFFVIVQNVLSTYNSASAYVQLSDWEGARCKDCGTVDSDCYTCEKCSASTCGNCYTCCPSCDTYLCSQCTATCSVCEQDFCHGCLSTCDTCQSACCSGCLDEQERCDHCHDKATEKISEPIPIQNVLEACHAQLDVHSDGVGEAVVST